MKKLLLTLVISSFLLPQLFAQNVGIGTTTPQSKLEVKGGALGISSSTKRYELSYDSTAGYFFIDEFGTARHLVIKNGGNIGMGTLNPAAKLDIVSTGNNPLIVRGANSQLRLVETDNGNKQWKVEVQAGSLTITEDGVSVPFKIEDGAGNNAIVVKDGGNVGIGTATPQSKFHVAGTSQADSLKVSSLAGTGYRVVMADPNGVLNVPNFNNYNNNTVVNISDNNCANPSISTINVNGFAGTISSSAIKIKIDITHTFTTDLVIVLVNPLNDTLFLTKRIGNDNFTQTIFDDNAGLIVSSGVNPFTGSYRPIGYVGNSFYGCNLTTTIPTFAAMGGGTINPNGTWKLIVYDLAGSDVGKINSFTIMFPTFTNALSKPENALAIWQSNSIDASVIKETANGLEFGAWDSTKHNSAGIIAYERFSDALDILGSGTTITNRKITFWNEGGANFTGKINVAAGGADINGQTIVDSILIQAKGTYATHNAIKVIKGAVNTTVDQSNIVNVASEFTSSFAPKVQSFTAGQTADLDFVRLYFDSSTRTRTIIIRIYQGFGTSGILIAERPWSINNSRKSFISSPKLSAPLVAGQLYTIWLSSGAYWVLNQSNTYGAGMSSVNPNYDFRFITYLESSPQQDAFVVTNEGDVSVLGKVKTNEFQMPINAGYNKVLASDNQGNGFWTPISSWGNGWTVNGNAIYSNNSGNVGIGNPFPIGKLDVADNGNEPLYVRGQNSQIRIVENDNGNKQWKVEAQAGNFNVTEDGISVPFTIEDGSGANALYVKNGGNVGIGTNNPSAKLHIAGNAKINSTNTLELGADILGKEANAGKIGYQAFTPDALDIIGAGTTGANRKIKFWNEGGAIFTGAIVSTGLDINGTTQTNALQISSTGSIISKMLNGQTTLGVGAAGVNNFTITFPSIFTSIPKVTATLETTNVNDVFTMSVKQISATSFVVQVYRIDVIGGAWGQSLKINWSAWE